jgi:ABC-type polysaccharide/polyol phosphate transport system ATPase subunit
MEKIDVSVSNISKRYRIPDPKRDRGRSIFNRFFRRKHEVWALKEINFDVFRGEALGIVGHNGSGKSTLVKLLSAITVPTYGEVTIRGTLSALVEVGAGFNLDLTGRENVFLSGSILGMGRADIARKMDEILQFAGIGNYIDAPVKTYSSGQFLRLGFATAAQLEQQIFVLDEVLAVGDVAFQARCFDRVDRLRRTGKTIVLVSHDLGAIERICDRAILLSRGELVMTGSPRAVVEEYSRTAYVSISERSGTSGSAKLVAVHFKGLDGGATRTGEPMAVHVSVQLGKPVPEPTLTISLFWPSGYICTQLTSAGSRPPQSFYDGLVSFEFFCPVLTMQRGLYRVDIAISRGNEIIGNWNCCSLLRVDLGEIIAGDFYLQHSCRISAGSPGVSGP